ncbi:hypothetical protein [Pectinatus frisingensis]|uniref:hypothetical protein n=1 Tax=Pectinatus frisingensis TaxID=865 RepID=UPI0018C79F36|nr:hypothetical protein [Pectinatus frisingensis]
MIEKKIFVDEPTLNDNNEILKKLKNAGIKWKCPMCKSEMFRIEKIQEVGYLEMICSRCGFVTKFKR